MIRKNIIALDMKKTAIIATVIVAVTLLIGSKYKTIIALSMVNLALIALTTLYGGSR